MARGNGGQQWQEGFLLASDDGDEFEHEREIVAVDASYKAVLPSEQGNVGHEWNQASRADGWRNGRHYLDGLWVFVDSEIEFRLLAGGCERIGEGMKAATDVYDGARGWKDGENGVVEGWIVVETLLSRYMRAQKLCDERL